MVSRGVRCMGHVSSNFYGGFARAPLNNPEGQSDRILCLHFVEIFAGGGALSPAVMGSAIEATSSKQLN